MPYSLYSSNTKIPPFCVKHLRMWSKRTKNCENREHSTWNGAFWTISIKIMFFWNVISCSLVVTNISKTLASSSKEEANGHYKPPEPICQTTHHRAPEDHDLNTFAATHLWEIYGCIYSKKYTYMHQVTLRDKISAPCNGKFIISVTAQTSSVKTSDLSLGFVQCIVVCTVWTFNHKTVQ